MLKKTITATVIGASLVSSAALAGVAGAATPSATTHGAASHYVMSHKGQIEKAAAVIAASTIGITPQQLVTDLKAGNSVAGVAAEYNVSAQSVVTAWVNAADAKINAAVTAGKLTQTKATLLEDALPTIATNAVNHTF